MKKSHTNFMKAIAVFLSLVMLLSVLPMQVFASDDIDTTIDYSTEIPDNIVKSEITSERNEYTKVYQLQDDTFYEITSPKPIHENIDGEWVEPDDLELSEPNTISEAIDYCTGLSEVVEGEQSSSISTFSLDVSDQNTPDLAYNIIGSTVGNYTKLTNSKLLVIDIPSVKYGSANKNQITIDCQLHVDCQNPTSGKIYAYGIKNNWNVSNNDLKSTDIQLDSGIIDFSTISTIPDIYTWDITDIYLNWEKGLVENNGIALKSISTAKANIGGCYITRQYKLIDSYDSDFTYHSFDMGRAGKVYVNDYTNTVLLARNEMGFDSNILPVELYRYFDFSKNYATTNPSGEGARWNYDSKLTKITSLTYSWETFDGSTINFVPNQGLYSWKDADGEGYTLTLDTQSINNDNYSNVTITTPENTVYHFGRYGKVVSITDEYNNAISISYTTSNQNNIEYIEDGLHRRYYFNYSNVVYDGTTLNTLVSIEAKFLNENNIYETVVVGGESAIVSYEYTKLSNNHIAISKVTYPDNESVNYSYDSNGYLTKIEDIDGKILLIDYTGKMPQYTFDESTNTISLTTNEIDQYPSTTSFVEKVKNIDDDSSQDDDQEYLLKSSLSIDRHNNYQRTFTDQQQKVEKIQYNQKLKVLYCENADGETYYADYSDDEDGNDYLSQIVSPANTTSIVNNYNFETGGVDSWFEYDGNSLSIVQGSLSGKGEEYLRVAGSASDMRAAIQNIGVSGSAGDIFVIGGWGRANAPIPTDEHFFGIEVYNCAYDEDEEDYIAETTPMYKLAFDSTLDYESQFRLGAFQLKENVSALQFRFVYSAQAGSADFDEAMLYKSNTEDVSFFESDDNTDTSTSSNDSSTVINHNSKGLVTSEINSDGTKSMVSSYDYDDSYYLSSATGTNNVLTSYSFDSSNGIMNSTTIGGKTTDYSYTAVGAIKEVSNVVSGLSNNADKINSLYSYTHDKIQSVTHNGMRYTFVYNSFGNVKEVKLDQLNSDYNKSMIAYDYSKDYNQQLNEITYADNSSLKYEYNNGNVTKIYYCHNKDDAGTLIYAYEYDSSNNISKIIDYESNRIIIYNANGYAVKEKTNDEANAPILYSVSLNENNLETVSLFGNSYTFKKNESSYNENTKETTYSSEYNFILPEASVHANFNSQSISDYFGRIKMSKISFSSPEIDAENGGEFTHSIENIYEYKDYTMSIDGQNIDATTSLISRYKSEIVNKLISDESDESYTTVSNSFISSYDYDSAGRITHIYYAQGEETPVLSNYYQYDSAGQLICELDVVKEALVKYAYDSGGNITAKTTYCNNDFTYNNLTDEIAINETANPTVTSYEYNNQENKLGFSDLLTSYDGHDITYDDNGNPLNYYGGLSLDTEYALSWERGLLKTVESDKIKCVYTYDSNNARTKKTIYSVNTDDNNTKSYELNQEINYILDNDKIIGYQITMYDSGVASSMAVKLLYDEYDSPIGVSYHTDRNSTSDNSTSDSTITALSEDNIFWFIKDGQGNVRALYSELDDFTLGCTYDAFGNLSLDISARFIDQIVEKINSSTTSDFEKFIYSVIVLPFTTAAAIGISMSVGENSYKGYIIDSETGLYYCQNRYYSPIWGRFISMDDSTQLTQNVEEPLNSNLYAYCYNDPVNNVDPTGKSSYSLTGVGMQAEMSACLLSFSGEVGIELVYVWSKNALYGYYYYGGGAGTGYTNKAINYFKSSLQHISVSPKVSLKNMANLFKLNWSITLGFFAAFTNKSFSWPNSYTGLVKSNSISVGKWKGYKSTANGCKTYGICYSLAGNSGFAFSQTTARYNRITFNTSAVKSYLLAQKNTIKNTVS